MVQAIRVPLSEFSTAGFAPYGVCHEMPDRRPDRKAGTHAALWNLGDLEFTLKAPFVGFVRYYRRGFICSTMERHPGETQTFVPVGGMESIVAVARPTEGLRPDPRTFRGFLLDGRKGLTLHRGTWVRHFFPIGSHADYVVVTGRRAPTDDVDNIDLAASMGIEFEFVLDEHRS